MLVDRKLVAPASSGFKLIKPPISTYKADLATEQEHQLMTAWANQTTG